MAYESVDALQKTLAETVFHYAADRKKAAGRALGTLVEIITFYTLCAWNLRDHIAIERAIPEFANRDIAHNVEFSLHPVRQRWRGVIAPLSLPLTPTKLGRQVSFLGDKALKSTPLLTSGRVKRNACILAEDSVSLLVANIDELDTQGCSLTVCELLPEPFAIFECKRVGVEEGMRKGPQTIEKAKQGAYVARTVSALQRVRLRDGGVQGTLEHSDGSFRTGRYEDLLREAIDNAPADDIRGFILTVGVVSNHGNWFTSENPNKELRVLSQAYDWLIFLTDAGLAQFIDKLLLHPTPELAPAREAFLASYAGASGNNQFTKVRIGNAADDALRRYFSNHEAEVETWFNVIAPRNSDLAELQSDLRKLADKAW